MRRKARSNPFPVGQSGIRSQGKQAPVLFRPRFAKAFLASAILAAGTLIDGCASGGGPIGSRQAVGEYARTRSFDVERRDAGVFRLMVLRRPGRVARHAILRVYIEGDGAPWPTRFHPPHDPTPRIPLALELATADEDISVAYVTRPCQYLDREELTVCEPKYWTSARFAPEVVEAYQQLLDGLVAESGAKELSLVGYSGGGVLAALLATARNDVVQLITVADPLRVAAWAKHHDVSPLKGLDPDLQDRRWPPAVHFVGENDEIVPRAIIDPIAGRTGARLVVVPNFNHHCCWARDWARLLGEVQ